MRIRPDAARQLTELLRGRPETAGVRFFLRGFG